jgi:hypothetical protein
VDAADGRLLAARVRIVGASPAHGALARDARRFAWDVRSAAAEVAGDAAWIEKVQVRTSAVGSAAALPESDDAFAELSRAVRDADAASLADELAPLAARLPVGLGWDPTDAETVRGMLADIERELPALLVDGGAS